LVTDVLFHLVGLASLNNEVQTECVTS
jgi:hypothetical protein